MTYNIEPELLEEYKAVKEKHPNIDHDMVMEFAEEMPTQFEMAIMKYKYGCHIGSKRMYDEAVALFENPNGTQGAYWDIDTIRIKSGIDFNTMKDYTLFDISYIANMLYSDFGDMLSAEQIIKMAKRYLTDKDYPGDPTERAYKDAKKRIIYFED
jgi:hypothetical protein